MSKVEQIFESVDFSEDTDLKDRLRAQLFGDNNPASSSIVAFPGNRNSGGRSMSGRILSFDELEMVSAAGTGGAAPRRPEDRGGLQNSSASFNSDLIGRIQIPTPDSGTKEDGKQ